MQQLQRGVRPGSGVSQGEMRDEHAQLLLGHVLSERRGSVALRCRAMRRLRCTVLRSTLSARPRCAMRRGAAVARQRPDRSQQTIALTSLVPLCASIRTKNRAGVPDDHTQTRPPSCAQQPIPLATVCCTL